LTRIAVTGHMNLTAGSVALVREAITDALIRYASDGLTGISCVARGADSVFAQAVVDLGGELEVVLPAAGYREEKVKPDHAPQFDELIRRAKTVRVIPFEKANRVAYEAANEVLVSTCDTITDQLASPEALSARDTMYLRSAIIVARKHDAALRTPASLKRVSWPRTYRCTPNSTFIRLLPPSGGRGAHAARADQRQLTLLCG
jgi:hypothetical protein